MSRPDLRIYTDGSCPKPQGPGGWAWVATRGFKGQRIEVDNGAGGEAVTTNNRMELKAVIHAVESVNSNERFEIVSDSKYVVLGINEWVASWVRKDWRKVKNPDLWKWLLALTKTRDVTFSWVRGHDGDYFNELADELCGAETQKIKRGMIRVVRG